MGAGDKNKQTKTQEKSKGATQQKPKTTQEVKLSNTTRVIIFYIGGAADKKSWWGAGPYRNIIEVRKNVEERIDAKNLDKERYEGVYLGYYEVFTPEQRKQLMDKYITCRSPTNLKIIIFGHSLGAWNGTHFAASMAKAGYPVEYLVTIDPVGIGGFVQAISDVIITYPGAPKAKSAWFNIRELGSNFGNFVADIGGRWVPGYRFRLTQKHTATGKVIPEVSYKRDTTLPLPYRSYISEHIHDYTWLAIHDREKSKTIESIYDPKKLDYKVLEDPTIHSSWDYISTSLSKWLKK